MTGDEDALVEHLDRALDAVLAVRVALGGSNVPVPEEALDEALQRDDAYLEARRRFSTAFAVLAGQRDADEGPSLLDFESTVNALVARAAECGWRLGRR